MELKALNHLHSKLEERKVELIDLVGSGSASSFEAYRELCGRIHGLQVAQLEIADLLKRFKDEDDE